MIWKFALPCTRIFVVTVHQPRDYPDTITCHELTTLAQNHPPPACLQTCRESREVGFKAGSVMFGESGGGLCGLWFNPEIDMLLMPYPYPREKNPNT